MKTAKQFKGVEFLVLQLLKSSSHKIPQCPVKSGFVLRVYNYTDSDVEYEAIQPYPSGNYRSRLRFYDDIDNCMLDLDVRFTIKSGGYYEF